MANMLGLPPPRQAAIAVYGFINPLRFIGISEPTVVATRQFAGAKTGKIQTAPRRNGRVPDSNLAGKR